MSQINPAIPDIIGEITAFRAWRIVESIRYGVHLESVVAYGGGERWPRDDWMRAHCAGHYGWCQLLTTEAQRRGRQRVPGVGCTCGIYAARDRAHLHHQWQYNRWDGVVIGEVGLAGRVIPGTLAYRAEKGRVLRLWVPHAGWKLVSKLEATYNIPVELTNVLTEGSARRVRD